MSLRFLTITFWLLSGTSWAAVQVPDLKLDASIQNSSEILTTERAWNIDSNESNPHLKRWMIEKKVSLEGLESFPVTSGPRKGQFGVRGGRLVAPTSIHLRPEGNWYRDLKEFSCEANPTSVDELRFATQEGSRQAAERAARAWNQLLSAKKAVLALAWQRVFAATPEEATRRGNDLFHLWLKEAELSWQQNAFQEAKKWEWNNYLSQARAKGICPKNAALESKRVSLESMMEPVRGPVPPKVFARAPAKLWNGLYSIKVSIGAGDKTLVGQFLLDSAASDSLVSPSWLLRQGLNPTLVEYGGLPKQKTNWSKGAGKARHAALLDLKVGGRPVPVIDFLVMETDLFQPPAFSGSCCDGVLGADFFKLYGVELDPARDGPSVKLYSREGFNLSNEDFDWVEMHVGEGGSLVSDCRLEGPGGARIPGVRWSSGNDSAIELHSPWQSLLKQARATKTGAWKLSCSGKNIVDRYGIREGETIDLGSAKTPGQTRVPGVDAGITLLNRGPVVFDAGHGRIWFKKSGLTRSVATNRTGLDLEFSFDKDEDRLLRITRIQPNHEGGKLASQAGLKPGVEITEVDGIKSIELDDWQVDQRLSGEFGPTVTLQWETPFGVKTLVIPVTR